MHVYLPFMRGMSDLARFLSAQAPIYSTVLAELRSGRKRTHWMWFIFPQLRGLGRSAMAERYGIASQAEASAYLAHEPRRAASRVHAARPCDRERRRYDHLRLARRSQVPIVDDGLRRRCSPRRLLRRAREVLQGLARRGHAGPARKPEPRAVAGARLTRARHRRRLTRAPTPTSPALPPGLPSSVRSAAGRPTLRVPARRFRHRRPEGRATGPG